MTQVTKQEIVEALHEVSCSFYFPELERIAESIEQHGIAPPDGWVLVPKEPTDGMADKAIIHLDDDPDPNYYFKVITAKNVYKAMLADAPEVSNEP